MIWIFAVTGAVIILLLIGNAIVVIPPVHYGIVLRFNKRTGRYLTEGLRFLLPLIEEVEIFESKLQSTVIDNLSFLSKDKLEVILRFLVQWRPDFLIANDKGQNKFIENTAETVIFGIKDAIRSIVGNIIGKVEATVFIENKKAVGRYIDCVLRLESPPHTKPSKIFSEGVPKEGVSKEDVPKDIRVKVKIDGGEEERQIEPEKEIKNILTRVMFYEEYSAQINELLRREKDKKGEYSEIESRYGIDIEISELSDVDFSEPTKKAFELKRQTEEKLRADEIELEKKISMMERLVKLGLNPQEAVNSAEVTLDQAEKKVHSIEGLDKLRNLVNVNITLPK